MGRDLDPDEERYYEEVAEEARVKLRALAPRGAALLLRIQKDPKYENSPDCWLVDVRIEAKPGEQVNMSDYLRDILGRVETRTVEGTPINVFTWVTYSNPNIAEGVTQCVGKAVWNDPAAYLYKLEG